MAESLNDILGYLRDVYAEDKNSCCNAEDTCKKQNLASIEAFVEYGREHLKNNPPVFTRFEDAGVGIQLQDGTRLVFAHYTVDGPGPGAGRDVPITAPAAGTHGVQAMRVDNTAMEVTGGATAPEWDRMTEDEK